MSAEPSVEQLQAELAAQSAALNRALAAEQEVARVAEERLAAAEADLAEARSQLGAARAELQWLRRAGIDLNTVMEHPVIRAGRRVAVRLRR